MTKVYVAMADCNDGAGYCHFAGVFSTHEKALKFVKEVDAKILVVQLL